MNLTNVSRRLSYLLRHSTEPLYIDLNGGWADVDVLIGVLKKKFPEVDRDTIELIVAQDEKGRYSFSSDGKSIRANQGHSIPGAVIEMEQPDPPELLYHGTATRFLDPILRNGLIPMSRQYVHISPDFETAVKVGKRHGKPVVLVIRAKEFVEDGNELYRSSNGVWQAKAVPPQYFTVQYVN
ncbi:MAG: RNA 2'-phosphotransferase [Ruminococcus sp.]|nr:RNA 2'-phosphotransferase [Ruminococcus sp.]